MSEQAIAPYLQPGKHCHLIGIGGVSMSPLAEVLHRRGVLVTGSDQNVSESVQRLQSIGIPVSIGHAPENIKGADCIIRTAAVHDDNPEVRAAKEAGIPVFSRAEAWGELMRHYKNAVCVAGTHGKTTTTSMCTHIAMAADADPTVMVGGTLPLLGSGYRIGNGDTVIFESCEYYNSFLSFFPTIAVILDIDEDHLDFFRDLDDIKHSFREFAELVPADTGYVVYNCEDPHTADALAGIRRNCITFGLEHGDVRCADLKWNRGFPEFDILFRGSLYTHVALNVPGIHNVKNALAAAASSILLGIGGDAVAIGLHQFRGAARRFEFRGRVNGADVYDDYAHHPGEIDALLTAVEPLGYKRVIMAFQPHTYSRTKALYNDFVTQLRRPDITVLMSIYPARETDTLGMSSEKLSQDIPGSICCKTLEEVEQTLRVLARPGDIILTVGAGQLNKVADNLVRPR